MKRAIAAIRKGRVTLFATSLQFLVWFETRPRPGQLIMVVSFVVAAALSIDSFFGWQVWDRIFYPDLSNVAKVRFWSALIYNLALILGLPVAFLIWHWRDKNARDQIEQQRQQVENSRKDTNLKEFLEVQGRAVGLFDEKMPASAREQLQIAALHQLRGFLRGEYGDSFRRPALELIFAGHAEAMERIGMRDVRVEIENIPSDELKYYAIWRIQNKRRELLDRIMREGIGIIRDELGSILDGGFPLEGRTWDFCDLRNSIFPPGANLSSSSFFFTNLSSSTLNDVNLTDSRLDGATLRYASLESARLMNISLQGTNLMKSNLSNVDARWSKFSHAVGRGVNFSFAKFSGSSFQEADFTEAIFEGTDLSNSYLMGSDLSNALLSNTNLKGVKIDQRTRFIVKNKNADNDDLQKGHAYLLEKGAVWHTEEDDDIPF